MKQSRIAIIAILMTAFASQVSAQESVVVEMAPVSVSFPTAVLERPFTTPAGVGEISAGMNFGHHFDANQKVVPDMASLSRVSAKFGLTDSLEIGVAWNGFQIPRVNWDKAITFNAGYFLFANQYAAAMASVDVPVHFESGVVRNVKFAMPTAFGIVKNLSLLVFYDSLVDFKFANDVYEASFNLPAKLTLQATPRLALGISTTLAELSLGSVHGQHFFWQGAPLKLHGLYAITNAFDIVADVGVGQVARPHQSFGFTLGLNYRLGNLG